MTTNRDWLYSLDVADLADWFDAEHVENQDGTLDGDTAALNAKIAELERKLRISWEYECKFQDERDVLQARVDELTAERDNWKANCEDWKKDCERYREKFGKCLDYADDIHALMDEGMA